MANPGWGNDPRFANMPQNSGFPGGWGGGGNGGNNWNPVDPAQQAATDPFNPMGVPLAKKSGQLSNPLQSTVLPQLTGAAGPGLDQGLQTLLQILGMQGQTDPKMFNKQLADISRTGQGQQDALQGQLARLGLGSSGAGQAVGGALRGATASRRSGAIAQEDAKAEQQKRQDLQQLLSFFINPTIAVRGQDLGVPTGPSEASDLEKFLGFASGALPGVGAVADAFGG